MPHSLIREEAYEKEFEFNEILTEKDYKRRKIAKLKEKTHGSKSKKKKHQEVGVVPFIKIKQCAENYG